MGGDFQGILFAAMSNNHLPNGLHVNTQKLLPKKCIPKTKIGGPWSPQFALKKCAVKMNLKKWHPKWWVFGVDFQGFVFNSLANLRKESPLRTCAQTAPNPWKINGIFRDTPWDPYYSHTGNLSWVSGNFRCFTQPLALGEPVSFI